MPSGFRAGGIAVTDTWKLHATPGSAPGMQPRRCGELMGGGTDAFNREVAIAAVGEHDLTRERQAPTGVLVNGGRMALTAPAKPLPCRARPGAQRIVAGTSSSANRSLSAAGEGDFSSTGCAGQHLSNSRPAQRGKILRVPPA